MHDTLRVEARLRLSRDDNSGGAGVRCCHPFNGYSSNELVIITLALRILEKNSDVIKGDRDINKGVLN